MKSAEVRDELVRALRLDLIGPEPGSEHEREELPHEPSRWYVGGFLVPFEAPEEQKVDPTGQEELFAAGEENGADDADVPERASARKVFLPSSVGLSLLVAKGADALEAEVTWGDYRLPKAEEGEPRGRETTWTREPKRAVVALALPGGDARAATTAVPDSGGLNLVVTARGAGGVEALGLPAGTRSVSVFLVNDRKPAPEERKDEAVAFQVRLVLRSKEPLVARPNATGLDSTDWDDRVADVQYRDVFEYAVGHGVSARAEVAEDGSCREVATEWVPTAAVEKVEPTRLEGVELGMEALAATEDSGSLAASLAAFPARYGEWIAGQRETTLDGNRAEAAGILLDEAKHACARIERGIALLKEPDVFKAFRVANRAMAQAARRRSARAANVAPEAVEPPRWRPFQLAFLLMNLEGIARPGSSDRGAVDLLFFPTGGGKTEAYLGLAAFTMVLRRLRNPGLSSAGVAVLMRYTLRLLTLDQLGRVAALVCALELEREADAALGTWPFEVGLWVGRAATPNRMGVKGDDDETTARSKTLKYKNDSKRWPPPIPLESCPWCGTPFTKDSFSLQPSSDRPTDLRVVCVSRRCEFRGDRPLPILTVDEPIYARRPAFLIATVDKFASLPWVGDVGRLFGKGEKEPLLPPELIIQDELHLISGPLGTMAGLYEIAVDRLASREEAGRRVGPKVVASTATIRRAEAQVRALFGRSAVYVFPPPGPDRRDSFFARTVSQSEKEPRTYVGLSAQGRSLKVLLLRTYLALLGASQRVFEETGGAALGEKNPADPYLTLLGYFSSLRELGGTRRIVEDEVAAQAARRSERRRSGAGRGEFLDRAIQQEVVELTSRESTAKVARAKDRLALPFTDKEHVDVALATNMISVGLDITRLGLMVVLGQPKTTSEYIQATSRVGRDDARPGLVVTLQNVHRPRDRSHYERFGAYHASFYRAVEATSVTPFSARALERAAAAVAVALARHGVASLTPADGAGRIEAVRKDLAFVAEEMAERASRHDTEKGAEELEALRKRVKSLVDDLLDGWAALAHEKKQNGVKLAYQAKERGGPPNAFALLRDPLDPELDSLPSQARKFRAQRSMRDVEPSVGLVLRRLDNAAVPDAEEAES